MLSPTAILAIARVASPLIQTIVRRVQDTSPEDRPEAEKHADVLNALHPVVRMLIDRVVPDDELAETLDGLIVDEVSEMNHPLSPINPGVARVGVGALAVALTRSRASGSPWCQPTLTTDEAAAVVAAAERGLAP